VKRETAASQSAKLPDKLLDEARRYASPNSRSVPKQIEFWSRIGKIAEENPDLPYGFIKGILVSLEEYEDAQCSEYQFDQ
jgi:hypothetical protein